MSTIHADPAYAPDDLYASLYQGDLVVLSGVPAAVSFAEFAREQLTELFQPHDPEGAHLHFTSEELAVMLGKWKPSFIHHERSKALVRDIITQAGFSAQDTHFDVPKPRTAFPVGHLSTGVAFAFPWHRDTWYAAPRQQVNWWLPIYPTRANNGMKFDLPSFAAEISNTSGEFDYYEANRARLTTAKQVKTEVQSRPSALGHEPADELVLALQPGSVLLFSGAHLHATVANTSPVTRYSIDFRTVDRQHVEQDVGAPMGDVRCTGTALRDFVSVDSGSRFDEQLVQSLYGAPPEDALVIFDAETAKQAAEELTPS